MLDYSSIYVYVCHVNTLRCILHENVIFKFLNYLNLKQAYEGNKMMQSPYLVDRDVLYIYIGYEFVIGRSIADMNLSDVMVVKAKVPLN